MKIFRLIAILVFVPALAGAGDIYKCAAADGSISFQATPCPDDAKEDRRQFQFVASTPRASAPESDDAETTSCRSDVLSNYEGTPNEIEAYYKKRRRQCSENFHDGSFQIKNCYQEQEEIKEKKYRDLEKQKERALARCDG